MKKSRMEGECCIYGVEGLFIEGPVRKAEGRQHSKDIGVDRRITLKFILKLE